MKKDITQTEEKKDKAAQEKRKMVWDFNETTSTISIQKPEDNNVNKERIESLLIFTFRVTISKDEDTFMETLRIECFREDKPNGTIITTLIKLDTDIKQFLIYGVALQDVEFFSLASKIKQEYLNLHTTNNDEEFDMEDITESVLYPLIDYIGKEIFDKKDFYYVPVSEFKKILQEAEYTEYQFNLIRRFLDKKGYMKKWKEKTSRSVRNKQGEVVRCVMFDTTKIDELIKKETPQKEEVKA